MWSHRQSPCAAQDPNNPSSTLFDSQSLASTLVGGPCIEPTDGTTSVDTGAPVQYSPIQYSTVLWVVKLCTLASKPRSEARAPVLKLLSRFSLPPQQGSQLGCFSDSFLPLHMPALCSAAAEPTAASLRRSRCPRLLCHSPHAGFLYDHPSRGHLLSLVTGRRRKPYTCFQQCKETPGCAFWMFNMKSDLGRPGAPPHVARGENSILTGHLPC